MLKLSFRNATQITKRCKLLLQKRKEPIMEHKNNFLATASSQAQGTCTDGFIDRFSDLPEGVAYHIFSFFTYRDLARVACVSKSFRQFYLSLQSLNFDGMPYAEFMWERMRLLNHLDRYLIQRGDNKIQHFRICWFFAGQTASSGDEYFRIISWIHAAARSNVEVLDLDFYMYEGKNMLALPSCIFLCRSLRSLMVNLKFKSLKTPSLGCSTTLQCLKLRRVTIDEELGKWISCSCKCIKELWLDLLPGTQTISIESPSLESLHFVSCYIYYGSQYPDDYFHLNISCENLQDIHIDWRGLPKRHLINIVAPNVKHFTWIGNFAGTQYLKELTCLEKAEFLLRPLFEDFYQVFEVLSSIRRVKVLVLNEEATQALGREGFKMPSALHQLCHFCIQSLCLNDKLVPVLAFVLREMPNLSTLHIQYEPLFPPSFTRHMEVINACKFDREYWASQKLACIDHLKEVTVELSSGSNEFEFAMYILEAAKNLKKMVVLYLPHQSNLIRTVSGSWMASSAIIALKERPGKPIPSYEL